MLVTSEICSISYGEMESSMKMESVKRRDVC